MKKLIIFFTILIALTGTAFAQFDDTVDWSLRAGAQIGYAPNFFTQSIDDADFKTTANQMEAGVFVDLPFLRFSAAYGFLLGATGDPEPVDDYDRQYIDVSVLGKFPLMLSNFTVWPAAGVGYQMLTFLDDNGDGEDDIGNEIGDVYDAVNDLYLLAGVGMDFNLTDRLVITPSFIFGYNLMPNPYDRDEDEGESFRVFKFNANIGVGFNF